MGTDPLKDMQEKIVNAANSTAEAAKGKKYKTGGKDVSGFDCSGFVWYVLNAAFPPAKLPYMPTEVLFDSSLFKKLTDTPEKGDLICFKKSLGADANHVGIVLDQQTWIGSQSSTGVAPVKFSNPYWSTKNPFFMRFVGVLPGNISYLQHLSKVSANG